MWSSDSEYENELVVIRGRKFTETENCSEMAGSYEYTDRFRLTTVKMEELVRVAGPFLHLENN